MILLDKYFRCSWEDVHSTDVVRGVLSVVSSSCLIGVLKSSIFSLIFCLPALSITETEKSIKMCDIFFCFLLKFYSLFYVICSPVFLSIIIVQRSVKFSDYIFLFFIKMLLFFFTCNLKLCF